MAAAALLVGGACDDHKSRPGGSTAGVDTSDARIAEITKTFCQRYAECDAEYFEEEYDSVADCSDYLAAVLRHEIRSEQEDPGCADALLDSYACNADLTCMEDADYICRDLEKKVDELCERDDYDDYDYNYATVSGTSGRLGLRIPR